MLTIYLKQAWNMLRANPLISIISVAGTALSIAMIMVVVLVMQIKIAGFAPDYHRDRILYANGVHAKAENQAMGSQISVQTIKACFYSLESAEAVTAFRRMARPVSLPARRMYKQYSVKYTDAGFWQVYTLDFLYGSPFTESDFQSAIPRAVITGQMAKELFGKTDVVGETIILDFVEYRVCGVVKEVSQAADHAYADLWVPYTTNDEYTTLSYAEGICGVFNVCILAPSRSAFKDIYAELDRRIAAYNQTKETFQMSLDEYPVNNMEAAMGSSTFRKVAWQGYAFRIGALLLFLILVPAINLTGVNQSSIQQRTSEMGLRKSFGATGRELIQQIICENMVITCIGGVIGFGLSFLFLLVGKSFLLTSNPLIQADMLFKPVTFLLAFLFILFLNVLSAFIPALRISRWTIVNSLKLNDQ